MIQKYRLHYIVVMSAAALMAIEVAGLGMLSNYFSSALQVSTNIIGVVLIATALGYRYGGRKADASASVEGLSLMILLVAAWIGVILANHAFIAALIGIAIPSVSFGSFLAAIALFALPTFLLAAVLPYAIKLHVADIEHSGTSSGVLYGLSMIGGIIGTVFFGVLLLPLLQYGATFCILVVMLLAGAYLFDASGKRLLIRGLVYVVLLITAPLASIEFHTTPLFADGFFESDHTQWVKLADKTSIFSRIQVHEGTNKSTGEPLRFMTINGSMHSASYLNHNELVFGYQRYNNLAKHFNPSASRALVIGGGSYAYTKYLLAATSTSESVTTIDVVEIDPRSTSLSEEFFGLNRNDPRLRIFHEDARTYLNKTTDTYDIAYVDVFRSYYGLPWQLTTIEAVQHLHNTLTENGIAVVNMIGSLSGKNGKFFQSELATFRSVFPTVNVYAVASPADADRIQNIILVAFKNADTAHSTPSDNAAINDLVSHQWFGDIDANTQILTDDFAPTDFYISSFITIHLF